MSLRFGSSYNDEKEIFSNSRVSAKFQEKHTKTIFLFFLNYCGVKMRNVVQK